MREGINIVVGAADRERLAAVVADRNSPQKHVWRARIILATAEGCGTAEIMRRAGVSKPCVWRWQERFMREGVVGLLREKTRKPGLPMKKGRAGTMTHDYIRRGTTTLFAALNVLDGTVIGQCMTRHRHQEFIRFLNRIEAAVPAGKLVHAILDNDAVHKHPKVRAWLARHPRWTFHFTPTSCSWANAVETFFASLTRRRLQRGVFHSLVDLQAAINRYLGEHNRKPKPFVWTADPNRIIENVNRGYQVIASNH
jgi:transposase